MVEKKKIYCIGDSHALFFRGKNSAKISGVGLLPFFKICYLGPALAYNLCEWNTRSSGREQLSSCLDHLPKGATVLLAFGEIDCRCHVVKQMEKTGKTMESVVADIAARYLQVIREITERGFRVVVWGPPPSARDEIKIDPKYPAVGTCKERNQAVALFGKYLERGLVSTSAQYVSLFNKFLDQRGETQADCHFDGVHLSQKAMPLAIKELRRVKALSSWDEMIYFYFFVHVLRFLYPPIRELWRVVLRIKRGGCRLIPGVMKAVWGYYLNPSLRERWGGPFNGQSARQKIFLSLVGERGFYAIVETGSFRGSTTEFILKNTQAPVFSVEYNPEFFWYSKIRLSQYKKCFLFRNDSRSFIRQLTEDSLVPKENVFFYLDAHWSADLPLEEEFSIICKNFKSWVVMIDDFKVPDDKGYGYDDYGSGKALELEYLDNLIKTYRVNVFFPATPSTLETGAKRGCVVLTSSDVTLSRAVAEKTLRVY